MTAEMLRIHYYAAARAARGASEEEVGPGPEGITTLGGLLTLMGERHVSGRAGGLSLAEVFERCTFLLDGRAASPEAELRERSRLDVIPPFAGG